MLKKELRKIYKEKRAGLSGTQKLKLDDLLLIQFQRIPVDIPAMIMGYAPFEKFNEYDPQPVIDYCHFKNPQQVLTYPVMNEASHQLQPVIVNPDTAFKENSYGIEEPVEAMPVPATAIDLVMVPLLAFDAAGNRVGYGKGYYDRFLKECRADTIKVGFSYFAPADHIDDLDEHDIKLDYCITPERVYEF